MFISAKFHTLLRLELIIMETWRFPLLQRQIVTLGDSYLYVSVKIWYAMRRTYISWWKSNPSIDRSDGSKRDSKSHGRT